MAMLQGPRRVTITAVSVALVVGAALLPAAASVLSQEGPGRAPSAYPGAVMANERRENTPGAYDPLAAAQTPVRPRAPGARGCSWVEARGALDAYQAQRRVAWLAYGVRSGSSSRRGLR